MALVVLVWGTNVTVVKSALDAFSPPAFMALRFALAALAMAGVLAVREGLPRLSTGLFWRLVALGLVGNTAYQVCFVLGVARTTAANAGLLVAATPVLVTLGGAWLGHERLTRPLLGGVALGLAGLLLVVAARGPSLGPDTLAGDALILGGSACWAAYTLGVRALGDALSPLQVTALAMLTGAPPLVLLGLPALLATPWAAVPAAAWAGLLSSALLALVVCYVLWAASVRAVGGSRTSVYNCCIPLVATATAWAVRGEQPTALQALGAGLILGGVLLTRRR
jgi:drug/metabolite transporter (DMT)-like permease